MDPRTSRWPAVTGLWLGLATWLYAALAAVELRAAGDGATAPAPDERGVADGVPLLVLVTAVVLGLGLLLATWSVVRGRARRIADPLLGAGLAAGAGVLWIDDESRPVATLVVGAVAVVLLLAAVLPERPAEGRLAGFAARLVLATAALLGGWVCAHELAELSWAWESWTLLYWSGLAVAVVMLLAAVLGSQLARGPWRWLLGLPTLLVGLVLLVGGVAGLREGYLLVGHEEAEPGWWLGGPVVFCGAGLIAAGLALLRGRWTLALGTVATTVLVTLGLVFGIPEMRSGF